MSSWTRMRIDSVNYRARIRPTSTTGWTHFRSGTATEAVLCLTNLIASICLATYIVICVKSGLHHEYVCFIIFVKSGLLHVYISKNVYVQSA